ncbi:rhomboid family intramembrane serine protease [Actinocrinis puniceicyclus]|nr:rhomboid family intramembrane serine protease [Actinocrinis puniceicyclus]
MPSDELPTTTSGAGAVSGAPVCFRHTDRETYLRCARCDRSICTDCMVPAPVGFQCPECVRGGSREVREVRTTVGGKPHTRQGLATGVLIGVCVVMFGLQNVVGPAFTDRMDLQAMAQQISTLPSARHIGVAYGDWYRLVSSMFVHLNLAHLAMNMVSLWWIGVAVESRLGRTRYVLTYFTCGIAGSAASYASLHAYGASLGASGAIFGLLGVFAVLAYRERLNMQPVITVILLNLVFSFTWGGISWQSHVGGLVAGLLLGIALAYAPRPRTMIAWFRNPQNVVPTVAGSLILLVATIVVLVHTSQLQDQASTSALSEAWTRLRG